MPAIQFDATTDQLSLASNLPGYDPVSITWHFYVSVDRNAQSPILGLANAGFTEFDYVGLDTNGTTLVIATSSGFNTGTNLSTGTWYYLAYRRSGSTHELYLNNTLDITRTVSNSFTIGQVIVMSYAGVYWANGRIAHPKIWNAYLDPAELAAERYSIEPVRKANLYDYWPTMPGATQRIKAYANGHNWSAGGTLTDAEGPPIVWSMQPIYYSFPLGGAAAQETDPGFISSAATVYNPTLTTGAVSITASFIASTAAVYASQVNLNLTSGFISTAAQVFSPTLTTGAVSISAGFISSTAAVYTPTLTTGAVNINAAFIASAAGAFNPQLNLVTDAAFIASAAAVFSPALTTGAVSITASFIASVAAVYNPTLNVGAASQEVDPGFITSTDAVFNPQLNLNLSTVFISSTAAVFSPQIDLGIASAFISSTATLFNPTLTTGAVNINASFISSTAAVYNLTVNLGSGPQTVTAQFIASAESAFAPQLNLNIAANFIATGASVFAPEVDLTIATSFIASTAQVYTPTLSGGAVVLNVGFISTTAVVYNPTLTVGVVDIDAAFISSAAAVFNPSLELTLASAFISSTATVYTPTLTVGAVDINANFISSSAAVYDPAVYVGFVPQELDTGFIASAAALFAPQLNLNLSLGFVSSTSTVYAGTYSVGLNPDLYAILYAQWLREGGTVIFYPWHSADEQAWMVVQDNGTINFVRVSRGEYLELADHKRAWDSWYGPYGIRRS